MLELLKECLLDFPNFQAEKILKYFDKKNSTIKVLKSLVKKKNLIIRDLNEKIQLKNKELYIQSQKIVSSEEELTEYINKLFEQQEKERIIKRIVDNVRDTLDIQDVLDKITEEIGKLFKADRCAILIFNDKENTLEPKSLFSQGQSSGTISEIPDITLSKELYKEVVINRRQIVFPKIDKLFDSKELVELCKRNNLKYFISTPIVYKNIFLGTIFIQKTKYDLNYSKTNLDILKQITSQVSVAINQAILYKELQETIVRERTIKNITLAIRSTLDINKLFEIISKEIRELFNADRVVIASIKKQIECFTLELMTEDSILEKSKSSTEVCLKFDSSDNFFKAFFEEQKILSYSDIENSTIPEVLKKYYEKKELKSLLALPIKKNNENWGGIFLTTKDNRAWGENQIELLKTIADQINIAIRQADLFSKINETNKLKDEFISGMSHEFRTPLNAIIGFSELLENNIHKNQCPEQQKYIKNILISAQHLLKLINDILDLSKIDAGKLSLFTEKFNQKTIITQISSTLSEMAEKKQIQINLNLIDYVISADMKRFKQIMYNLINNSIKFTPEGGKINIYSYIENNCLTIEVEDTGIGISSKDQEKIFQRFSQIDSSMTRNQEGTGLGLALTKKLTQMHNWTIDFESESNKGSRFWFNIPLNQNVQKNFSDAEILN